MFSKIYDEKILRFSPRKDTVFFFIKKPIVFNFYGEVFAFAKAHQNQMKIVSFFTSEIYYLIQSYTRTSLKKSQ